SLGIASMGAYLLNPWAFVQFAHNQLAAVVTGSFVVAAIGSFYALRDLHPVQARLYFGAGTFVGLIASLLVAFPTGAAQATKFCPRTERLSKRCVAGQHRASLLLVPYHDHARDAVHRPDGVRHVAELARKTRIQHFVAMGIDAGVSVSLHREHSRVDDRRART